MEDVGSRRETLSGRLCLTEKSGHETLKSPSLTTAHLFRLYLSPLSPEPNTAGAPAPTLLASCHP